MDRAACSAIQLRDFVSHFAIRVTGSLRGAYIFYIGLLVVNMILTAIIHPTRYNKDVATEQELMK